MSATTTRPATKTSPRPTSARSAARHFSNAAAGWSIPPSPPTKKNRADKIERYSREYFDLIERHGKHVAQYLALDEPVVIKLGGTTYEW